jgi:hypothetical protein
MTIPAIACALRSVFASQAYVVASWRQSEMAFYTYGNDKNNSHHNVVTV